MGCSLGVGASLYQAPPGSVGVGAPICTREHINQMSKYDVQQLNSRALLRRVADVFRGRGLEEDGEEDWSCGAHFPWWVWLASTGAVREAVGDGIFSFTVKVLNGRVEIVVCSTSGLFEIHPRKGVSVCKMG